MYLVKVVIYENKGNVVLHTNSLFAAKHESIKTLASDSFYRTSRAKICKNAD